MAVNEYCLFPCNMSMVIMVTNCYCQCAGDCLGWMSTVTHDNRDEELFLVLPVKCP